MRKTVGLMIAGLVAISGTAMGQNARVSGEINLDFLADMLRSASAAHAKVKDMELEKNFSPESRAVNPDGSTRTAHQTAVMVGTGAGIGAAIGGMSRNQKGVLIGVIAGSAGGLIVDQIMRHKAEKERVVNQTPVPEIEQEPARQPQVKERPEGRRQ